MIITLEKKNMNSNDMIVVYIIVAIISLIIFYFLLRWVFGVDKQIKQNNTIIELLKKIADK